MNDPDVVLLVDADADDEPITQWFGSGFGHIGSTSNRGACAPAAAARARLSRTADPAPSAARSARTIAVGTRYRVIAEPSSQSSATARLGRFRHRVDAFIHELLRHCRSSVPAGTRATSLRFRGFSKLVMAVTSGHKHLIANRLLGLKSYTRVISSRLISTPVAETFGDGADGILTGLVGRAPGRSGHLCKT